MSSCVLRFLLYKVNKLACLGKVILVSRCTMLQCLFMGFLSPYEVKLNKQSCLPGVTAFQVMCTNSLEYGYYVISQLYVYKINVPVILTGKVQGLCMLVDYNYIPVKFRMHCPIKVTMLCTVSLSTPYTIYCLSAAWHS